MHTEKIPRHWANFQFSDRPYLSAGSQGNTPAVSHIEVDKGNGTTMTITPEEDAPFAYVLDHSWNVIVYGADGSIIRPVERSM